jgi:hypothetical protein
MMRGVELVEDQTTRKPAIGLGPRVSGDRNASHRH